MANLPENSVWEAGVYQLETTDPVIGGPEGVDNKQGKQLANRTVYLKGVVDALTSGATPAGKASTWTTARSFSMTGDGTWTVSANGSGNVTAAMTLANSGVAVGSYTKVTVDAKGRVTAGVAQSAADIPALDWSKITTGKPTTMGAYGITDGITGLTGTANQINVSAATGAVTLSLPQSIHTAAKPVFAQVRVAADPVNALECAPKQYVDNLLQDSQLNAWRNAGVFEFVVPDILKSGRKRALVRVRGGGAAGGSPASNWTVMVGGGGGQGGLTSKVVDLTGINSVTVTVGAGGAPVIGAEGSVGATSSFGSHCSATGGKAAKWDGSDGGSGVGGDFNLIGAAGFPPVRHANNDWGIQGRGGSNKQGSVGAYTTIQDGAVGQDDGAGGNGGTAAGSKGGAGAAGWVSIEW